MAWTDSRIFRQAVADMFGNVAAMDLDADTFRVVLYNNTITPDNDVTAANSAYNVGQWVTAQEVFQAGQWAQAGVALSGVTLNAGTADVVFFDATDPSSGTAATLANVYGMLCYDDTLTTPVADQGLTYNYFGGVQSVTNGQLTIVLNALGILRITL